MENLIKQGAQYQWQQDSTFTLTAEQFGTLYNSLTAIVTAEPFKKKIAEAQETLSIVQLQQVMTDALNNAIATGVATEMVPAEQAQA